MRSETGACFFVGGWFFSSKEQPDQAADLKNNKKADGRSIEAELADVIEEAGILGLEG